MVPKKTVRVDTPPRCPRCESATVAITRPPGPHSALARCGDCGHAWWLPAPWTVGRALAFRLPFGQHKGRTVAQVAESEAGRDYLRWMSRNVRGNAGIAARLALDSVDQARSDVSVMPMKEAHRDATPMSRGDTQLL